MDKPRYRAMVTLESNVAFVPQTVFMVRGYPPQMPIENTTSSCAGSSR
jgi:hypothetical protein